MSVYSQEFLQKYKAVANKKQDLHDNEELQGD